MLYSVDVFVSYEFAGVGIAGHFLWFLDGHFLESRNGSFDFVTVRIWSKLPTFKSFYYFLLSMIRESVYLEIRT